MTDTRTTDIRSAILKMDTLAAFDLLTDLVEEVQARASDTDRWALAVDVGSRNYGAIVEPFDILDAARAQLTHMRADYRPDTRAERAAEHRFEFDREDAA